MKQLLVLSGKGGTGKTTISSALIKLSNAKAFADCDVEAPNLHLINRGNPQIKSFDYWGMDKAVIEPSKCLGCNVCFSSCRFEAINRSTSTIDLKEKYNVDPNKCEGCGVCEVVCPVNAISLRPFKSGEIQLYKEDYIFSTAKLKMGSGTSGMLVTQVKKLLQGYGKNMELAIIDGPPGVGCPVIASISGVDLVLLVAEPSKSGLSDLKRVVKTIEIFKVPVAVCINKYDVNLEYTEQIEKFCMDLNLTFIGKIPYDREVIKAVNQGLTIVDQESIAKNAVIEVYDNLMKVL